MITRIVPIYDESQLSVVDTSIDFFVSKFVNNEYFSYSRMSVEWWMLLVGAFKRLGYEGEASIEELGRDYMLENIDLLVAKMIEHWDEQQKRVRPWEFNHKVFVDIMKVAISPKREDFYFAVSDRAFYAKDLPAKSGYPLFSTVIKSVLPPDEIPYNALCFRRWGQNGDIRKLISSIEDRQIVLVGPSNHKTLGQMAGLKKCEHILVHSSLGTFRVQKYYDEIVKLHNRLLNDKQEPVIYLFTCGSVGLWLINKLHDKLDKCFMLDMGRSLDAYLHYTDVRKKTPSWMWGDWLNEHPPKWAKSLK